MTRTRNVDGGLSEAAWQAQVEGLARFYGFLVYHAPDNKPTTTKGGRQIRQRVERGFPDLILLRGPELIVAELKAERGRMGPGQEEWLAAWRELASAVWIAHSFATISKPGGSLYADRPRPVVDVYVWRPSDFEAVNNRLARGRNKLEPAASLPMS